MALIPLGPDAFMSKGGRVLLGHYLQDEVEHMVWCTPELFRAPAVVMASEQDAGQGRAALLQQLMRGWLEMNAKIEGKPSGVVLLTPTMDLIVGLLQWLPAQYHPNVLVIDFADGAYPIGLNPLDALHGRERDQVCQDVLTILQHIWEPIWSFRIEEMWSLCLATLFEANAWLIRHDSAQASALQYTLLDIETLLSNWRFRREVLSFVSDVEVLNRWRHIGQWDEKFASEVTAPLIDMLRRLTMSEQARQILGQGRSTVDLASVVANGKIVLVHTADALLGPEVSTLVGSTCLNLAWMGLWQQMWQRIRQTSEVCPRMQVVVDGLGPLGNRWEQGRDLLRETRKFGGHLVLALPSVGQAKQVGRAMVSSVIANTEVSFAFTPSVADVEELVASLNIADQVEDMPNLGDGVCYYCYWGRSEEEFQLEQLIVAEPDPGTLDQAEMLRAISSELVGQPRRAVERVLERAQLRRVG